MYDSMTQSYNSINQLSYQINMYQYLTNLEILSNHIDAFLRAHTLDLSIVPLMRSKCSRDGHLNQYRVTWDHPPASVYITHLNRYVLNRLLK